MPLTKETALEIYEGMHKLVPDAHCELLYNHDYELLISVMLSAQSTDIAVNKAAAGNLYIKYPTLESLANAPLEDVEKIIGNLGLSHNKARNLKVICNNLIFNYGGKVPNDKKAISLMPGCGNKTASVVVAELFKVATFAVDTHVQRLSIRLGLAEEGDTPDVIQKKLESVFPKELYIKGHHTFIIYGRRICHSKNPECDKCTLGHLCKYYENNKN